MKLSTKVDRIFDELKKIQMRGAERDNLLTKILEQGIEYPVRNTDQERHKVQQDSGSLAQLVETHKGSEDAGK